MKNKFKIFSIVSIFFLTSCGDNEAQKIADLETKIRSLEYEISTKNSKISSLEWDLQNCNNNISSARLGLPF